MFSKTSNKNLRSIKNAIFFGSKTNFQKTLIVAEGIVSFDVFQPLKKISSIRTKKWYATILNPTANITHENHSLP